MPARKCLQRLTKALSYSASLTKTPPSPFLGCVETWYHKKCNQSHTFFFPIFRPCCMLLGWDISLLPCWDLISQGSDSPRQLLDHLLQAEPLFSFVRQQPLPLSTWNMVHLIFFGHFRPGILKTWSLRHHDYSIFYFYAITASQQYNRGAAAKTELGLRPKWGPGRSSHKAFNCLPPITQWGVGGHKGHHGKKHWRAPITLKSLRGMSSLRKWNLQDSIDQEDCNLDILTLWHKEEIQYCI